MATFRKRGAKWQVQVRRASGFQRSASFRTKRDAERWAAQTEIEADRSEAGLVQSEPCSIPLTQLIARYKENILPLKRSAYQEGYILDALRRQSFADLPADRVAPEHIARFRDERLQQVSPSTINRSLVVLSSVFETARTEWGFSTLVNPVSKIRKPTPNPSRTRRLSTTEEIRLREALSDSRNPVVLPLTRFALETAMRLTEMLTLQWPQVCWSSHIVELRVTKNGEVRHVPMSGAAMNVLQVQQRRHPEQGPFPSTQSAVKQAWRRAVQRAEIGDLHFHDLRHEAISRMFERGLSMPEVALISGHRDPRMLMKYTHIRAAEIAQKME